jgi:hypothetical protein
MKENCCTVVLVVVHRVFYSNFILSLKKYKTVATTFLYILKFIQKSKNHQRRIFLDNYYRQRCLV